MNESCPPRRSTLDPFARALVAAAMFLFVISLLVDDVTIPRSLLAGTLLVIAAILVLATVVMERRRAKLRRNVRRGTHEAQRLKGKS